MIAQEEIEKIIDTKLNNYFRQFEALQSIKQLFADAIYIPPTRGWAGSPDFLLKLVELVITESPKYVAELGSGVSSVVLGLALSKFGNGKLVSIDHDNDFAQSTRKFIEVNKLTKIVKVEHCPLSEYQFSGSKWKWYDLSRVNFEHKIDLLVVDGPPRLLQERSRFPALPILKDKLSTNATIILDDSNRENEQQVIEGWKSFLNDNYVQFDFFISTDFEKGMAIFKLKSGL
jgi:hypothetical protein